MIWTVIAVIFESSDGLVLVKLVRNPQNTFGKEMKLIKLVLSLMTKDQLFGPNTKLH